MRRWRLHGEQQWRRMGVSFTLGAGYFETVRLARCRRTCDEPGCDQVIQQDEPYVDYWTTRGHERHEAYCVAHAPVAVELA
jgi:hypothetical protein